MAAHQAHIQAEHLKNTVFHDCVVVPTTLDPRYHTVVARLPTDAPVRRAVRSSQSRPARRDFSSLLPEQMVTEDDPPDNATKEVVNNDGDELMRDAPRN